MCISYLLLCKKTPQILTALAKRHFISSWLCGLGQREPQVCVPCGMGCTCLMWLQFELKNPRWCHSHVCPHLGWLTCWDLFPLVLNILQGLSVHGGLSGRLAQTSFYGGSRLQKVRKKIARAFMVQTQKLYNVTVTSATFYWLKMSQGLTHSMAGK